MAKCRARLTIRGPAKQFPRAARPLYNFSHFRQVKARLFCVFASTLYCLFFFSLYFSYPNESEESRSMRVNSFHSESLLPLLLNPSSKNASSSPSWGISELTAPCSAFFRDRESKGMVCFPRDSKHCS